MTPFLFKIALTMHITGFVILAGIMLADFVTFRQFWKLVNEDWQKAQWLRKIVSSFSPLIGIGGLLVISSGIALLTMMPVDSQLWFRLKMILVILFILNMFFIGPRQAKKLDQHIASRQVLQLNDEIKGIKKRLNFFYISQLLIMLSIFILSSFRF
ncbi:hypothetical protein [Pedobacter gandavensis]|uniref:DUF2269 family protein n=1 Tax=Pedobacter gandavensis TaxID=2679963 RepID=A0ABR6F1K2_9SPHI|nr:hypothetical protein [Pedobacter gandavensis]MBB2151375.1 hypothetical protein [Pedobacter gandavensis]